MRRLHPAFRKCETQRGSAATQGKQSAISHQPSAKPVEPTSAPQRGRHITAQGRDHRERTLGLHATRRRTLKGFHTRRAGGQPLQGWCSPGRISQGVLLRRDPGLWWITPAGYRGFQATETKHSWQEFSHHTQTGMVCRRTEAPFRTLRSPRPLRFHSAAFVAFKCHRRLSRVSCEQCLWSWMPFFLTHTRRGGRGDVFTGHSP